MASYSILQAYSPLDTIGLHVKDEMCLYEQVLGPCIMLIPTTTYWKWIWEAILTSSVLSHCCGVLRTTVHEQQPCDLPHWNLYWSWVRRLCWKYWPCFCAIASANQPQIPNILLKSFSKDRSADSSFGDWRRSVLFCNSFSDTTVFVYYNGSGELKESTTYINCHV